MILFGQSHNIRFDILFTFSFKLLERNTTWENFDENRKKHSKKTEMQTISIFAPANENV